MGRPKGSKNKYKGITPKESRECLGGCGLQKELPITSTWLRCKKCNSKQHNMGCMCFVCQAKRREWKHKKNCQCYSCKNKRGEEHKKNCTCCSCKEKRGEHRVHSKYCACYFCKSHREGNSGNKNGMFGRKLTEAHKEVLRSDNHTRNVLRKVCRHPNTFEINALNYLNTIYYNKFVYTGNGTLIINHKSADAYSKELNTVVLFNGTYWHLERYGYTITEENKRLIERKESEPFIKACYKIIFIWDDELNSLIKETKC